MKKIREIISIGMFACSIYGCSAQGSVTASVSNKEIGNTSVKEKERITNKDGSTEVKLSDGSSITFEGGTSEEDIQAAIRAIQSGELKTSQGALNGGSDTDQSEDISADEADTIETFQ